MDFAKEQRSFLSEMAWQPALQSIVDGLPDVAFFVKDREGRFVMNNRRSCEICRVASPADVAGKTDSDFWDDLRANLYREGDRAVMESGCPIINEVTLAPDETGSDRLIIYSKFPVRNRRGEIIGVAGIHRELEQRAGSSLFLANGLGDALEIIHKHFGRTLNVTELARAVGMSNSTFNRRFRKVFGASPAEYLARVRVQAVCRLLEETSETVAAIAQETGFCDHSHLSRVFSAMMGMPPSRYRSTHRSNG